MTDRLTLSYRAVLVRIARDLDEEQQKQLQFLCKGLVPRRVKVDVWTLLLSLEDTAKISWVDVVFLKERLHIIGREDLVVALTEFEMKRDLSILLNFYVKKKNGLHPFYQSSATETADYLVRLMERFQGKVDVRGMMRSLGKKTKDLWLQFASECISQSSGMTWAKFSMLVALAGEIISASSINTKGSSDEAMEMCITLADELSSPMLQLGCWVR